MKIEFIDNNENNHGAILISGTNSVNYSGSQILCANINNEIRFYEIRYEYHCSPYKSADLIDNILIVGFEEFFYVFDTITNNNILSLKLSGYFDHYYQNNNLIYVADASGIYCLDINGVIYWHNNALGIDGVMINEFDDKYLYGCGEWDPPSGWVDFILDKQTGVKI